MSNLDVIKKVQEQQRSRLAGDLSKRILGAMENNYLGPQTANWLANMKEDLRISGGADGGSLTSVAILDKLFDEFQRYAFQYNRNEPNRDYIISCKRPDPTTQSASNRTYLGFLFNSRFAMLGIAEPERVILSFVAPRFAYEHGLRSSSQDEFRGVTAFLEFEGERVKDQMLFRIANYPIGAGQLPTIAKAVFARFIRVTRGECSGVEPLSLDILVDTPRVETVEEQAQDEAQANRLDMIAEQILTMLETLDEEIREVEGAGVAAVRSKRMDVSNMLLERSKALRSFRSGASDLAVQWSAYLSGKYQQPTK